MHKLLGRESGYELILHPTERISSKKARILIGTKTKINTMVVDTKAAHTRYEKGSTRRHDSNDLTFVTHTYEQTDLPRKYKNTINTKDNSSIKTSPASCSDDQSSSTDNLDKLCLKVNYSRKPVCVHMKFCPRADSEVHVHCTHTETYTKLAVRTLQ